MAVLTLIFVFVIVVLFLCHWVQTYSHKAKLLRKFPTQKNFKPIVGHILELSTDQEILFYQLRKMNKENNQTYSFWGGIEGTLHIIDAEDAEIILSNVKHIDKGYIYTVLDNWLQGGLLTSTRDKWHQRRKMLTPAFHYNILQMFVEVFGEKCETLTKILREECGKSKTNILPIITKTTLSAICESSMGIKCDQNDKGLQEYLHALENIVETFIARVLNPLVYNDILYLLSAGAWRQKKLLKYIHKFSDNIIKTREKNFRYEDIEDLETNNIKSKKRLAMLDLLFYAKKNLGVIDDAGIREEVDTFVFTGHDTTTSGICFALLQLAAHKDIQEKVIEELDQIFGESKRHPTYDDLQDMKYLERCIKESLRLCPVVPFIVRNIKEDVPLTHHVAPANIDIFIHIYDIHRNPKYFPDPEKFDPDRFLPENSKGRHPFTYIPFSAGPRNCIGQKFAMLELKSVISSILRNFTMEAPDPNVPLIIGMILKAKGPMNIKFKPRH